jgi:hypothetical protein
MACLHNRNARDSLPHFMLRRNIDDGGIETRSGRGMAAFASATTNTFARPSADTQVDMR